MAKPAPKKELEFYPDAWSRFERFIRDIAKAGPQHRAKPKTSRGKKRVKRNAVKKGSVSV